MDNLATTAVIDCLGDNPIDLRETFLEGREEGERAFVLNPNISRACDG